MCTGEPLLHMCFVSWSLAHSPNLNIYHKYIQPQIRTATLHMQSYGLVYIHAGSAKVRLFFESHRVCCTAGYVVNPETQTPPSTPIVHQHIEPSAIPMTSHSYTGSPEANMCVINSHTHTPKSKGRHIHARLVSS